MPSTAQSGAAQQQQQQQQQHHPEQMDVPAAFVQDPAGYLAGVASQSSSKVGLSQLAGKVAAWMTQANSSEGIDVPTISFLYLQAAAKQLLGDVKVGDVEQEMIRAQQQNEVLEVRNHMIIYLSSLFWRKTVVFIWNAIFFPLARSVTVCVCVCAYGFERFSHIYVPSILVGGWSSGDPLSNATHGHFIFWNFSYLGTFGPE